MEHTNTSTRTSVAPLVINISTARAWSSAQPAVWSARCKSGYRFDGRVCRQFARRGELLCCDCASAVVIAPATDKTSRRATWLLAVAAIAYLIFMSPEAIAIVAHLARRGVGR